MRSAIFMLAIVSWCGSSISRRRGHALGSGPLAAAGSLRSVVYRNVKRFRSAMECRLRGAVRLSDAGTAAPGKTTRRLRVLVDDACPLRRERMWVSTRPHFALSTTRTPLPNHLRFHVIHCSYPVPTLHARKLEPSEISNFIHFCSMPASYSSPTISDSACAPRPSVCKNTLDDHLPPAQR